MGPIIMQLVFAVAGLAFVLRFQRLPKWLTFGGMIAGMAIAFTSGSSAGLLSALGCLGGMLFLLPLSTMGLAGPRDLQVAMALGALAGWPSVGIVGLSGLGIAVAALLARALWSGSLAYLTAWGSEVLWLLRGGGAWQLHLLAPARGRITVSSILLAGSIAHLGFSLLVP